MNLDELLRRPARWASVLRWATLAGLELGVIGPFGSYKASFFNRIVYWTVLFWAGTLVLWPSVTAGIVWGPRKGIPPIFSGTAVVVIACIPLAALSAAWCSVFWPLHASGIRAVEWYGLTAIVVLPGVAGLLWIELVRSDDLSALRSAPAEGWTASPPHDAPVGPTVLANLPDHLLANALCLQMEDHHVRIYLHGRSHLHFAAMSRVVPTMNGRGLQVHRSWWVSLDAVRGWRREDRSITLILVNGLHVPVARHRVATLRAEGWLAADQEELKQTSSSVPRQLAS